MPECLLSLLFWSAGVLFYRCILTFKCMKLGKLSKAKLHRCYLFFPPSGSHMTACRDLCLPFTRPRVLGALQVAVVRGDRAVARAMGRERCGLSSLWALERGFPFCGQGHSGRREGPRCVVTALTLTPVPEADASTKPGHEMPKPADGAASPGRPVGARRAQPLAPPA